ncbi:MAG: type II toxin-antitoxin system HicA family toxin [Dehalococcoidia bacterium]
MACGCSRRASVHSRTFPSRCNREFVRVAVQRQLPVLRPWEVVRILERAGLTVRRQTGAHLVLFREGLQRPVTVPLHPGDLPRGTLRAIIRQAGLTVEEFVEFLS